MKIGDRLYCYNDGFDGYPSTFITAGNIYVIVNVNQDKIFITSNDNNQMWFTNYKDSMFLYSKFFYNLKEYRKKKLKQLKQLSI